jgi:hypothetical protein
MPFTSDTLLRHKYGSTFIETGTYLGDGVQAALDAGFDVVHSIELDTGMYDHAKKRFDGDSRVVLWNGDSADILGHILKDLGGAMCTVWLDAHASGPLPGGRSGGTPVIDELRAIAASKARCLIMIDDRRLFGSSEWSGVTEIDAIDVLNTINCTYEISHEDGYIADDILVCTPVD